MLGIYGHAPSSMDQILMDADIAQKITLDFDKQNKTTAEGKTVTARNVLRSTQIFTIWAL